MSSTFIFDPEGFNYSQRPWIKNKRIKYVWHGIKLTRNESNMVSNSMSWRWISSIISQASGTAFYGELTSQWVFYHNVGWDCHAVMSHVISNFIELSFFCEMLSSICYLPNVPSMMFRRPLLHPATAKIWSLSGISVFRLTQHFMAAAWFAGFLTCLGGSLRLSLVWKNVVLHLTSLEFYPNED